MPGPADSVRIAPKGCGSLWPLRLGRGSPWEPRVTQPFLAQSPLETRPAQHPQGLLPSCGHQSALSWPSPSSTGQSVPWMSCYPAGSWSGQPGGCLPRPALDSRCPQKQPEARLASWQRFRVGSQWGCGKETTLLCAGLLAGWGSPKSCPWARGCAARAGFNVSLCDISPGGFLTKCSVDGPQQLSERARMAPQRVLPRSPRRHLHAQPRGSLGLGASTASGLRQTRV